MPNEFSLRLKEARERCGYKSQQSLADAFGVAQSTVGNWEAAAREPSLDTIMRLADFLGVSADWLLGKDTDLLSSNSSLRIPVLGTIPAGIPIEAIEDIVDWEEIPRSMLAGDKEYFGLKVKGNSMYPDYLEGDTIIVRRTQICNSGDDCVVYVNGYDATLKQVKLGTDGSITIIPRNPEYPPRTFSVKEVRDLPVSIAGVVVELRRKVK